MAMSTLSIFVALSMAVQSCSAAMAAWWTDIGPQFARQDPASGGLMYSMCNSNNTPIFPTNPPLLFSLNSDFMPKNNTPLTGQGWYTGGTTWASIFYQDVNSNIVNAVYTCDWPSGKFVSKGSYMISGTEGAPRPHGNTGLSSVLQSSQAGYHIFYHDGNKMLHQLTYSRDLNDANWAYGGVVSRDPAYSNAIACQVSTNGNISLVSPKDNANIEVSRFNSDGNWYQATFPRPLAGLWNQTNNATNLTSLSLNATSSINFTLPAFDGKPKSLGFAIDKQYTRSLWYVGTDRRLYEVSSIHYVWTLRSNQSNETWPLADDPSAEIAVASNFASSAVRIYYMSQGALVEAKYEQPGTNAGLWRAAAAVPTVNDTAAAAPPPGNSTAAESAGAADAGGLSSGAKAGIAVGVILGILALGAAAALVLVVRRRRARGDAEARAAAEAARALEVQQYQPAYQDYAHTPRGTPPPSSVSPYSGTGWPLDGKDAHEPPQELGAPRQVFEMPEQQYSHELVGEGHIREMQ